MQVLLSTREAFCQMPSVLWSGLLYAFVIHMADTNCLGLYMLYTEDM